MKDNFSRQAANYAAFRPVYPFELYQFLLTLTPERHTAWDCGCGNGQVAVALADHFNLVEATDISQKQLDHAVRKENIHYNQAKAEQSGLETASIDLITVAQAIHWFDFDAFYREVYRVGKPGSVIAVWGYCLLTIDTEVDRLIKELYSVILGEDYWDAERRYIDEQYQTIPFPFEEITSPGFSIIVNWSLDHLTGYLNSWSAVQHYIQKNKVNPVEKMIPDLKKAWGEEESRKVIFPLFTRVGRVKS
jgi:SAM-dependent methyltransferase